MLPEGGQIGAVIWRMPRDGMSAQIKEGGGRYEDD
jgi:hypothetical protein